MTASDLFATAFLLPLDSRLSEVGATYIRNGDDYFFSASSVDEGRSTLQRLEEDLRGVGLALNDDKTAIMRSFNYQMYLGDLTLDDVIEDLRETISPSGAEAHETLLRALVLELQSGRPVGSDAEHLGRRCLICLAASQTVVDLDCVEALLQWFPKLAPHASMYLSSIACGSQDEVSAFLVRLLDRPDRTDWTTGWLCAAVQAKGLGLGRDLARRLKAAVEDRREGMLTRTSALGTLAVAGQLTERTWRHLGKDATPAVQSEMVFSALFEPDLYPWPVEGLPAGPNVKSLPS